MYQLVLARGRELKTSYEKKKIKGHYKQWNRRNSGKILANLRKRGRDVRHRGGTEESNELLMYAVN